MPKKYTTILFDADDTLLDFGKDEKNALIKIMKDYNLPVTEENCSKYSEINLALWKQFEKGEIEKKDIKATRFKSFFNYLGITDGFDPLEVNGNFMNYLCEGGNTLEGAVGLCKFLKQEGYDLYIITNGTDFIQKHRFARSGLTPYFTQSFISEIIGYQKPKKEFFDIVLERVAEKDKSKILVIGDSLSSDIKGAMNAGLDCVWLNMKNAQPGDEYKPDYIINDITQVKNILL